MSTPDRRTGPDFTAIRDVRLCRRNESILRIVPTGSAVRLLAEIGARRNWHSAGALAFCYLQRVPYLRVERREVQRERTPRKAHRRLSLVRPRTQTVHRVLYRNRGTFLGRQRRRALRDAERQSHRWTATDARREVEVTSRPLARGRGDVVSLVSAVREPTGETTETASVSDPPTPAGPSVATPRVTPQLTGLSHTPRQRTTNSSRRRAGKPTLLHRIQRTLVEDSGTPRRPRTAFSRHDDSSQQSERWRRRSIPLDRPSLVYSSRFDETRRDSVHSRERVKDRTQPPADRAPTLTAKSAPVVALSSPQSDWPVQSRYTLRADTLRDSTSLRLNDEPNLSRHIVHGPRRTKPETVQHISRTPLADRANSLRGTPSGRRPLSSLSVRSLARRSHSSGSMTAEGRPLLAPSFGDETTDTGLEASLSPAFSRPSSRSQRRDSDSGPVSDITASREPPTIRTRQSVTVERDPLRLAFAPLLRPNARRGSHTSPRTGVHARGREPEKPAAAGALGTRSDRVLSERESGPTLVALRHPTEMAREDSRSPRDANSPPVNLTTNHSLDAEQLGHTPESSLDTQSTVTDQFDETHLARLTDSVYEQIERRLKIERRRRGEI